MTAIRHVRAFTRQIPVYPKEATDERRRSGSRRGCRLRK